MLQDIVSETKIVTSRAAKSASVNSWFFERVQKGRKEVFTEIMTITPEMAKRFLENNQDNRIVNQKTVKAFAQDIKSGNWELNGETIIISKDGELNDGAHRLLAIIEANTPAKTIVVFGLPRKSRMTVDIGRSRRASDFLNMANVINANYAAATCRMALSFTKNDYFGNATVITKQDVIHFYEGQKKIINYAVEKMRADKPSRAFNTSSMAAAYYLIHAVNSKQVDTFFDSLLSGVNLDRGSPILLLRQRLMMPYKIDRTRAAHKLELILRYWNAWREGKTLVKHISLKTEVPNIVA